MPPSQQINPTNRVVLGVELVKTVESVSVLWERSSRNVNTLYLYGLSC